MPTDVSPGVNERVLHCPRVHEPSVQHGRSVERCGEILLMRAAERGYELAQSIKAKGKIMTADQVHEYFINDLDEILEGN